MKYSVDGKSVLITGASSGIGAALARELAPRAKRLILVARRQSVLETLAGELPIETLVLAVDLALRGGVDTVIEQLGDTSVDLLVNCAGVGLGGPFATVSEERLLRMIELNVVTVALLTRRLLPRMLAEGTGAVLTIGSTTGFQGCPFMAAYAGTKAFANTFTQGLAWELYGTGVTATVLAPGTTRTEFFDASEIPGQRMNHIAQDAHTVARNAIRALERGRASRISGGVNRLLMLCGRFSPQALTGAVTRRLFRP